MENIFLISQDFKFNIQLLKDKGFTVIVPLLLTYLKYQGYIKLIKIKSKTEESVEDSTIIAYKDLENLKNSSEYKTHDYKLSQIEIEDINNGILIYAIAFTTPKTDPIYKFVSQAAHIIKEKIILLEKDDLCTLFEFYEYLQNETIDDSKIEEYANIILDLYFDCLEYSLDYAGLNAKEYREITKLMINLLGAKSGCLVHPYAGPANIISQLNQNIFYTAAYNNVEHYIAYNIYADIIGVNAKFTIGGIQFESTDSVTDYVFYDNIVLKSKHAWKAMMNTIENNAKGVFLINNKSLRKFKSGIAKISNSSTPTFIMSEKVSHIIFFRNEIAIIIVQKEKKNKDIVTLVNETNISEINAAKIWNDIRNNKNCYNLSIEEFNKEHFEFNFNRFVQKAIINKMSKISNMVKLEHLLLERYKLQIDIYKFEKDNTYKIKNIYVLGYSKFLPYYSIKNKKLVNIPEEEALKYQNRLLLVNLSERKCFQPKILAFDKLDNISFLYGDTYVYRINDSLVDITYLIKELNEDYILEQLFPTQDSSKRTKWEDLLECYIKMPNTGSNTPIKEQRIIYNDEKLVFLQRLLSNYSYKTDDFASVSEVALMPGTVLNNKYEIIEELGSGGFGKTYKATMKNSDNSKTVVAIKEFFYKEFQFRAQDGKNVLTPIIEKIGFVASSRIKFMNEANKIKTFDSENIVKVYDVFNENETCYYAMEYINGINLAEYSARKGVIEENEAIRIIKCAANALKIMHNENMLHLDVKPENIMIDNNGRVVLVDFGAAHKYNISNDDNSTLIEYASPGFTAPGAVNKNLFKPCRDIYSLGATLYYMLSVSEERKRMKNSAKKGTIYNLNEESIINEIVNEFKAVRPNNISDTTWNCIEICTNKTFYVKFKSIDEFLAMLPDE